MAKIAESMEWTRPNVHSLAQHLTALASFPDGPVPELGECSVAAQRLHTRPGDVTEQKPRMIVQHSTGAKQANKVKLRRWALACCWLARQWFHAIVAGNRVSTRDVMMCHHGSGCRVQLDTTTRRGRMPLAAVAARKTQPGRMHGHATSCTNCTLIKLVERTEP